MSTLYTFGDTTVPYRTESVRFLATEERDPLFHDNPSYDVYKYSPPPAAKADLIITLDVTRWDFTTTLSLGCRV